MKVGIFIPIGNNGWLLSENAPQYKPTFALNKEVAQTAEHYGLDFVLSMIKLRGFGGKTEFWDHNLESFTLMAGLAAVTSRIGLVATASTSFQHPFHLARKLASIDHLSEGRAGWNLVTSTSPDEARNYGQAAALDSDTRHERARECLAVVRGLWTSWEADAFPRDRESGYYADMTRTFVVGDIPEELAEYHRLVYEALQKSLAEVKAAGVTRDYDGRYGATTGSWTTDQFIETVYRDLSKR